MQLAASGRPCVHGRRGARYCARYCDGPQWITLFTSPRRRRYGADGASSSSLRGNSVEGRGADASGPERENGGRRREPAPPRCLARRSSRAHAAAVVVVVELLAVRIERAPPAGYPASIAPRVLGLGSSSLDGHASLATARGDRLRTASSALGAVAHRELLRVPTMKPHSY